MRQHILKSAAALTTLAAMASATTAIAQTDSTTTVASLKVTKAYAYVENNLGDGKSYAAVVFKTANALPRRFDGMIRASGALDGVGSSVGSVRGAHGKSANCYRIYATIKDGKLPGVHTGTSGKLGSHHLLTVTARGTDGDLTSNARVTLTRKRAGDNSGKRIGC